MLAPLLELQASVVALRCVKDSGDRAAGPSAARPKSASSAAGADTPRWRGHVNDGQRSAHPIMAAATAPIVGSANTTSSGTVFHMSAEVWRR